MNIKSENSDENNHKIVQALIFMGYVPNKLLFVIGVILMVIINLPEVNKSNQ